MFSAFMHRLRLYCLTATGLMSIGFPGGAQAQSLVELYETARGYDATYLAARALADSAQARAQQVHALRRPSVNFSASGGNSTSDSPVSENTAKTVAAGVSARQTLYNRANGVTIDQADDQLEASAADLEAAEQALIVRVAATYFDVLGAIDALETARANKKAIAEQLASAKRNFEVGTSTITDTREAQARYDLSIAQEIAATNDLLTKQLALDQLVGRTAVKPKALKTPVALAPLEPANVENWITHAETAPPVRTATLAYAVAKLETEKAKAGHLPTVDLEGSYQRGKTSADGVQTRVPFAYSGPTTQSSVAMTLRMPLFAGFSIQNRVKETLALEEQSRNNLDAARRGIAQATRQAFFNLQSGHAQVKALEAAESSSQLALDATLLGYKVGVRVNVDVLNAQTQLYTTRRDLAKARYDVVLNGLRLKQVSGQLKPEDVQAANRLLVE